MSSLQEKFNELLLEAIDETLCSLGEPVKNYLYYHLENDIGIKKQEIPEEIDDFSKMLHKIYGLGASRLEIKFMENLYSKIKVDLECPDYNWSKWIENDMSFIGYVDLMRESFINSV
jgi:hypothetical protein